MIFLVYKEITISTCFYFIIAQTTTTAEGDAPRHDGILAVEKDLSKQAWEQGHPDYRGASSMDNIIKKIETTLATPDSGKTTKK